MSGITLLTPGQCGGEDDCYPCESECEEAPSRTACQYRSGVNGETVTTRPTVTIDIVVTGGGSPDCGGCDFEESYAFDCGDSISDTLESCSFTGTWPSPPVPDDAVRTITVFITTTATGFRVDIVERITYPTPPAGGLNSFEERRIRRDFAYDDFHYMDCDDDAQLDANGDINFTAGTPTSTDGIFLSGEETCGISATITASND